MTKLINTLASLKSTNNTHPTHSNAGKNGKDKQLEQFELSIRPDLKGPPTLCCSHVSIPEDVPVSANPMAPIIKTRRAVSAVVSQIDNSCNFLMRQAHNDQSINDSPATGTQVHLVPPGTEPNILPL